VATLKAFNQDNKCIGLRIIKLVMHSSHTVEIVDDALVYKYYDPIRKMNNLNATH